MRKILILGVVCCSIGVAWHTWNQSPRDSAATGGGSHPLQNFAFGLRVAGSWLIDWELPTVGMSGQILSTTTADGTVTNTSSSDFDDGFNSPEHGAWKRTGHRTLALRGVKFQYDDVGTLTGYLQGRTTLRLDPSFDEFSGEFMFDLFGPTDDPLESPPLASFPGTLTGRRIIVE